MRNPSFDFVDNTARRLSWARGYSNRQEYGLREAVSYLPDLYRLQYGGNVKLLVFDGPYRPSVRNHWGNGRC